MKTTIDTLLYPKWIIPIEPHNTFLEHHALAIHEGRIVALLPASEAKINYQAKTTLELSEHAVMPGLINAHAHSPMTLFRGMADDLALMDWLINYIWPAEKKWLGEEFIRDGTELAVLEMLRGGTTCFNENYWYGDITAEVAIAANMRAIIGAEIIDFPTPYAQTMTEYLAKMAEFCQKWQNHPLIKATIHPQGPYTVNDATFLKLKDYADKFNLITHIHLHETADEINQSLKDYGKRPLKRLYDLGLVNERLVCIHMTQINDEDWSIITATKLQVVHCPESNLKLASGFCPVNALLAKGINVALGTDGAASNNDLDMFGEMHTAAILAKLVSKNPSALNAADSLRLATLNGARAFGLDKEIGSLLPGKYADLIAIDLSHPNTQPVYNPISQIAYAANSQQVTDVWVAGKRVLANGEFTTLDKKTILAKANAWKTRIAAT